jgi:hypothetical protein
MIEYTVKVQANGDKYWYLNGKRHREDGPSAEYANGEKRWFLKGKLHREDGPAVEYANGTKLWYLNGKLVTEEEHKNLTSKATCEGKVVEIDGIKYELKEV